VAGNVDLPRRSIASHQAVFGLAECFDGVAPVVFHGESFGRVGDIVDRKEQTFARFFGGKGDVPSCTTRIDPKVVSRSWAVSRFVALPS
jgi:hypothetical protein